MVLPFANLSSNTQREYFVDGLTEDLISECNMAFTYKGKPFDVKQVARDVGVRYVLQGSVRKVRKRVRVNARLTDAETGAHPWVNRFDRDIVDLWNRGTLSPSRACRGRGPSRPERAQPRRARFGDASLRGLEPRRLQVAVDRADDDCCVRVRA